MSDAARLSRIAYLAKPPGQSYIHYKVNAANIIAIDSLINNAILESAYSSIVSYAEAMSGIKRNSISWSIVRLYYSCFYCIRCLLLLNKVVPFNGGDEMLFDVSDATFHKGGKSSHHWNWRSIGKIKRLASNWPFSSDSEECYGKLREHRENVNYTHGFTDPHFHPCLISAETSIEKRLRSYRDDSSFSYTYLTDHLAIAYPTKLIFELEAVMRSAGLQLDAVKLKHIDRVWSLKERCPLS